MSRKNDIAKIRRWLKKNELTEEDYGFEKPLSKMSDKELFLILDDMADDDAAVAGREDQEREALEYMLEED